MAQFDVYRLPDGMRVVDVQSRFASVHATRLVIPLIAPDEQAASTTRLNPLLEIDGETWILAIQFASTLDERLLRTPIASLARDDLVIKGAIDFLINGF